MITTKRKSILAILTIMLVVMSLMTILFCIPNVALAEEVSSVNDVSLRGATKDNINMHVKGDFIEGNRMYGSYHLSFYIDKIAEKQYKIRTEITLTTQDYKTDKYFYQTFGYYFSGKNVRIKSTLQERIDKLQIYTKEGSLDKSENLISYNTKELASIYIDFDKQKMAKVNVYPIIKEEFIIEVTGTNPSFGIYFDNMDLMGVFLAKDTRIKDNEFVILKTVILSDFNRANPTYRYAASYKSMELIKNAVYTTLGGPIPSNWSEPEAMGIR